METNHELMEAGAAIDADKLAELARRGFRSIIDLRDDVEPHPKPPMLCPRAEAEHAKRLGLVYGRIPLGPSSFDYPTAQRLAAALFASPRPLYIHCASGVRARTVLETLATSTASRTAAHDAPTERAASEHASQSPLASFCAGYLRRALEREGKMREAPGEGGL